MAGLNHAPIWIEHPSEERMIHAVLINEVISICGDDS
jgi:hypothetical protein